MLRDDTPLLPKDNECELKMPKRVLRYVDTTAGREYVVQYEDLSVQEGVAESSLPLRVLNAYYSQLGRRTY